MHWKKRSALFFDYVFQGLFLIKILAWNCVGKVWNSISDKVLSFPTSARRISWKISECTRIYATDEANARYKRLISSVNPAFTQHESEVKRNFVSNKVYYFPNFWQFLWACDFKPPPLSLLFHSAISSLLFQACYVKPAMSSLLFQACYFKPAISSLLFQAFEPIWAGFSFHLWIRSSEP